MFLYILAYFLGSKIDRAMSGGHPAYQLSIFDTKKYEKYVKTYKDGGAKFFSKILGKST